MASRLRHLGQRFTAGRRALVEALTKADRPVTIEEILRVEPHLPLSSTYRNLAILQQAGVVHRVSTDHETGQYRRIGRTLRTRDRCRVARRYANTRCSRVRPSGRGLAGPAGS